MHRLLTPTLLITKLAVKCFPCVSPQKFASYPRIPQSLKVMAHRVCGSTPYPCTASEPTPDFYYIQHTLVHLNTAYLGQ